MENTSDLLEKHLDKNHLQKIRTMGQVAESMGMKLYLVGGVVRDLLMGKRSVDLDVVVEGDGIRFANKMAEEWKGKTVAHKKFYTAILVHPDKTKIDVATTREEIYPQPGMLPVVERSVLKRDLYRRDFTINAMALDLMPNTQGELIDFFGGQNDLKNGVIRILHNLSFRDDPTRIFRAIRFEQRFGFKMEKLTEQLLCEAVNKEYFKQVSSDRIQNEVILILREQKPVKPLKRMEQFGLQRAISPGLQVNQKTEILFSAVAEVLSWFKENFPGEKVNTWHVYFMALADQLKLNELQSVMQFFNFNRVLNKSLLYANEQAEDFREKWADRATALNSEIYQNFGKLPIESSLFFLAKSKPGRFYEPFSKYILENRFVKTELKGEDLLSAGIPAGPEISHFLDKILCARLDKVVKTKADERAYLKKIMSV